MKKGYVFSADVMIAAVIVLVAIALFFSTAKPQPDTVFITDQLSQDIIGVLANTNVDDLCHDVGTVNCNCPLYPTVEPLACRPTIQSTEGNMLALIAEAIETGTVPGNNVEDMIHELFVANSVIDENRFGFALLYTDPIAKVPLEMYNTETYSP